MPTSFAIPVGHGCSPTRAAVAQRAWVLPQNVEESVTDAPLVLSGPVLHFEQDAEIYAEGDATRAYYKVIRGVVRTCKFLDDGRRQIDAFYLPGEVFGLEAGTEHRLSAEASSECAIISNRRRGDAISGATELFARQLFSYAMRCFERAQKHAHLLCHTSAVQKVAGFLIDMEDRAPDRMINLQMTRQDIADYLGLTIETVSRTLSQLEREDVIKIPTTRRIVVTNQAKLRRLGI